jgi:glycosyltransferase involved in cell wall biosynthesis
MGQIKIKKSSKINILIIIPAYNEERSIDVVIKELRKELSFTKHKYEIVVVDDGSKDKTADLATNAGAKVIKHIINSGAGAATMTGLKYGKKRGYELVATLDADGQHEARDVIKGLDIMLKGNVDLLIGSRPLKTNNMSLMKVIGNKGLGWATYLICGVKVKDSQSGLRILSKRSINELSWITNDYGFCSEMLWRARQRKLTINEYPIKTIYSDYSLSKGQSNWNGTAIVRSLILRRIVELFGE